MIPFKTDEWPHGLRCMDCDREMTEGDTYSERLYGFHDDVPGVEIVCPECGLKEAAS